MGMIEEVVDKPGISQRMLAKFRDADHTHLSRSRISPQGLPTTATPQLTALYQILLAVPPILAESPVAKDIKALQEKAFWYRPQIEQLNKKLQSLKKTSVSSNPVTGIERI
jgi:hypothetical protein